MAGWAGPIPATRRSSAGWPANSITASGNHYQDPAAWKWQHREEYGNRGQGTAAIDGEQRTMWIFEPHVAEQVFEDFVRKHGFPVHRDQWLDRDQRRGKDEARIRSIKMLSGRNLSRRMFIDATYEGDLMAAAGVDYHVGREARVEYDEQWNGVQTGVLHHRHHFGVLKTPIDPYVVPGDPASGLLPRISADPPGRIWRRRQEGPGLLLSHVPDQSRRRIASRFPSRTATIRVSTSCWLRIFDAGWRETFDKFDPIPNHKTDTNNHGPFSTDNIGFNYDYPEADYERRRRNHSRARDVPEGLMYFLANDPRVPEEVRTIDEPVGVGQGRIRRQRPLAAPDLCSRSPAHDRRYVMTENELLKRRPTPESIGMGSYAMDSHNVQRYVTPDGHVQNEGDIGVSTNGPYQIALRSIQPRKEQCANLLVPVCVSSSHIAFGSIRMEPVFMILGQSAATAAAMAIDEGMAVQDVSYARLRSRLMKDHQVLESLSAPRGGVRVQDLEGIVVDDAQAVCQGVWLPSKAVGGWVGAAIYTTVQLAMARRWLGLRRVYRARGVMKCGSHFLRTPTGPTTCP